MTTKPKLVPELRFPGFAVNFAKAKVGDIAKVTSGATPSRQKAKYWDGNIPWVTTSLVGFNRIASAKEFISEDGLKNSATRLFPRGTVIMALYGQGVTRGKVAILDIDAATNQACAAMLIRGEEIYSEFLFYELQRRYDELRNLSNDGSQKNLSGELLKNLSITIPTLPEQRKIADFLTAVDGRIGQLRQKKDLLEDYKKGVMQQLFTQALRFKDDHGNDYPAWEEKTLGAIGTIVGGGTPDSANDIYWKGDVQWFTPTEISSKYATRSKRTISAAGLKNCSASILPIGTLLLTSRATIAEVSIATEECTTNQGFQSIIVNKGVNNEFIYYWVIRSRKEFLRKAQGSTFLEIGGKEMRKMPISIPSLPEQTKIANFLTALDRKIESVAQQVRHTQAFKKGLLQQMFV